MHADDVLAFVVDGANFHALRTTFGRRVHEHTSLVEVEDFAFVGRLPFAVGGDGHAAGLAGILAVQFMQGVHCVPADDYVGSTRLGLPDSVEGFASVRLAHAFGNGFVPIGL